MSNIEYDIHISGEELQPVYEVSAVSPKYTDPVKYAASFEASRLKSKLGSLQPGELYLLPSEFSAIDLSASGLAATLTTLDGDFAKARRQSRTDVQFAQLVLDDPTRGQKAELVAVKYTRPPLAAREFAATQFINTTDLSGSHTPAAFTPLGFVNHPEKSTSKSPLVALITKYEHSVLTLDRIFWDRERDATPDEVAYAFGVAAVWLAGLHAQGIAHGDAQPKNIAHGNTNQPRYVDLETAVNFRMKNGEISSAHARTHMADDIETFLRHLEGDYTGAVPQYFTRPYLDLMRESVVPDDAKLSEEEITDISKESQRQIARFGEYV